MVFKIPASGGHLKKNRFEFELSGETVSLPKLEFVPAEGEEYLASIAGQDISRTNFVLGFITAIDPELGEKVRGGGLARDQVEALYKAWAEASKVDEGESSASARS